MERVYLHGVAHVKKQGGTLFIASEGKGVVDEKSVVATGSDTPRTLADRFGDVVNVKDFGAVGDGKHDNTNELGAALLYATMYGKEVVFPSGKYMFSRVLLQKSGNLTMRALGNVVLHSTATTPLAAEDDYAILLRGEPVVSGVAYPECIPEGAVTIARHDLPVEPGDLIILRSSRLVGGETRSSWTEGCVHKVVSVTEDTITLAEPTHVPYETGDISATVTEQIDATHCKFNDISSSRRNLMHKCVCTSGLNSGDWRWISDWDNDQKIATFATHSAATEPSHNRNPWSYAPAVGDTFVIQKRITVSVVRPIHIEMYGDFTVERDFVDYDTDLQYRFMGFRLQWSDQSTIHGGKFRNFPYTTCSLDESYYPTVTGAYVENANDPGTGYGFRISGSYRPRLLNCTANGCRSGCSTANAGVQSVFGHLYNFTVYAGNTLSSTGKIRWPRSSEVTNYGYGGHGDAFGFVYSNCHTFDIEQGGSVRDYNATFINCFSHGMCKRWLYAFNFCGLRAYNCRADIYNDYEQTRFVFLHNRYDPSLPLIVDNCDAGELTGAMVYFDSTPYEHANVHITNNRVVFVGTKGFLTGFGGGSTANVVGENCEFRNNIAEYRDYTGTRGFFAPRIHIQVKDNTPVRIGITTWYVKVTAGSRLIIPMSESLGPRYELTMTSGSNSDVVVGALLYPGEGRDSSPFNYTNKTSEVHICKNAEGALPDKFNVYLESGHIGIVNNTEANAWYIIDVKGINRS